MHGYVDLERKTELYGQAWVNLTASASEGWSLTVMEAALCGTPSGALPVGGLSESIVDGETGVLAPDAQALAARVRELIEQPELRERLGDAAERRARSFSWDRSARAYLEVLSAEAGVEAEEGRARTCALPGRRGRGQGPVTTEVAERDFGAALAAVEGVKGWMSDDQARRLWDAALRLRAPGRIVEIGSFHGRSTIVLRRAAEDGVEVVAVDPHGGGDRGPQEITPDQERGNEDYRAFHANLERAGAEAGVRHVRLGSERRAGELDGPIDLLYVDGAHRYAPARDDIARYGARVSQGGTLLIHDTYNAVGVMLAQLRLLFLSREWRYVGRSRSLAEYRRAELSGAEVARNALSQAAGIPWFIRNCAIKVAVVARMPGLARRLGLPDADAWPY